MLQSRVVDAPHEDSNGNDSASPTRLSVFDRMKQQQQRARSSSDNNNNNTVARAARATTQGVHSLAELDDDALTASDKDESERESSDDGSARIQALHALELASERLDNDSACDNDGDVDGDGDEYDDEDESELKAQFYRQQQREQHDDVERFLTLGLQLELPRPSPRRSTCADKSLALATQTHQQVQESQHDAVVATPCAAALVASDATRRRRRQSNAVLPDGVLHVWVYQARQLSFRQHFVSMYDRHGLHVRCYLSWRKRCLSKPMESRRNISGHMTSPVWRMSDDHAPNLMRGHFALPLGDPASPESLPANTELVIEIVCGILVVSAAKISLLAFFQDRSSESSAESNSIGIVSGEQQWYPLVGPDAGLLELGLEFIPANAFDDDDDAERPEDEDTSESVKNTDASVIHDTVPDVIDDTSTANNAQQDALEDSAMDAQHRALEQRTLMRTTRFECSDMLRPFALDDDALERLTLDTTSHMSNNVVVSNNGKTTMYIPPQCQVQTMEDSECPPPPPPSSSNASDKQMDEQLLDLYLHGISSNDEPEQIRLDRAPSAASQLSQFSFGGYSSMYSQRSDASMLSRKASTCVTDVLSYNELIRDMETSLDAERQHAGFGWQAPSPGSTATGTIPKADGSVRFAAPTTASSGLLHPSVATMGTAPPRSALKKPSDVRRRRASSSGSSSNASSFNNNNNMDDNDDDDDGPSSVQEAMPRGVVLFDLSSIPERLRVGFERSTSEDNMTMSAKIKAQRDAQQGRRRSLPVNSLTPLTYAQQQQQQSSYRPQPFAIHEHSHEKTERVGSAAPSSSSSTATSSDMVLRRKRRSSLQSLADLQARERSSGANAAQLPHAGPSPSAPASRLQQRRGSNASSHVHVGGAVLSVGKFINVGNVPGVVRYVGPTNFASGIWIGVELCEKRGKNNGTVKGIEVRALGVGVVCV